MRLDPKAVDRILYRIASKEFDPKRVIEPELFAHTFGVLNKAVDKGFGRVEYGTEDAAFVEQVRYNNAVFAAAKTFNQQNDLTREMFDEKGRVRSFGQFRKEAEPIIGAYNVDWLQTEYSTAIVRSQHAQKWREMERDADLYPNLEWMPSTSAHPREAHRTFYGLILPMNHPFWSSNYPGNLWGCKCGIRSTAAEPTDRKGIQSATKGAPKGDPGLDENPGATGAIFSRSHPYFAEAQVGYKTLRPIVEEYANKAMRRYTLAQVKAVKETIDPYRGLRVYGTNLHTGSATFLRRTFRDVKSHNPDFRVLAHLADPAKAVRNWEYIGRKEVGVYPEGHKLAGQRKHPDAEYFCYYKVEIDGQTKYVHTKVSRQHAGEVPYVITENLDMTGIKNES